MPTGTGKTRLFTSIIRDISLQSKLKNKRNHVLIIAHRTELIEQISDSLNKYGIIHGIIAGTFKEKRNYSLPIQVASIQTITNHNNIHIAEIFNPNYIIIDEAHHSLAHSYKKLWKLFPSAKKLGVTATPWRMDGAGFIDIFDKFISSMSIKDFIRLGWLAPYSYYSVPIKSHIVSAIDGITKYGIDGDFSTAELEKIMSLQSIRAQLFDSYNSLAKGKKGIIYSISRYHSKLICEQYSANGVQIAEIDGTTPSDVRSRIVREFKEGKIDIIVNVDIFSEGFDCPDIEFIQLARPTKSLVKFIQQIGRGLRKNGNKQCIILDNVGLYTRFGLPDDDRDWYSHFIGYEVSTNNSKKNTSTTERNIELNLEKYEEGVDEMQLIQSLESLEYHANTCADYQQEEPQNEPAIEIRSKNIFAKYNVLELSNGIYLENIKSLEKLRLCDAPQRRTISLKIVKTVGRTKHFTIVSSFNRNSSISSSDCIIGYLFKEGNLLKFSVLKTSEIITIRI